MYRLAATPKISTLSTRYVRCSVSATDDGAVVDPTTSAVSFAFIGADDTPEAGDWVSGSWETTSVEYLARCLVGPDGDTTLAAGNYTVWLKIVLSPETIIEDIGELYIY